MLFTDRYAPNTEAPHDAFYACICLSDVLAQEIATGLNAGTGPGTPDPVTGFPTVGTLSPGSVVELAADGTWVVGTSPAVSGGGAALPKALYFVHQGTVEEMGSVVGKPVVARGLARFKTPHYAGASFPPGQPLFANAGNFELKVLGDGRQVVGFIGPDGLRDGVLDVQFEACAWG